MWLLRPRKRGDQLTVPVAPCGQIAETTRFNFTEPRQPKNISDKKMSIKLKGRLCHSGGAAGLTLIAT